MVCDRNHENPFRVKPEQHVEWKSPHKAFANSVAQDRKDKRTVADPSFRALDRTKKTPSEAFPGPLIQPGRFENLVVCPWVVDDLPHFKAASPARARSCTCVAVRPVTRPDRSSS